MLHVADHNQNEAHFQRLETNACHQWQFTVLMIVHNAGLHNAVHLFSKRDDVMCMHAC
jgi:hypothetical protein